MVPNDDSERAVRFVSQLELDHQALFDIEAGAARRIESQDALAHRLHCLRLDFELARDFRDGGIEISAFIEIPDDFETDPALSIASRFRPELLFELFCERVGRRKRPVERGGFLSGSEATQRVPSLFEVGPGFEFFDVVSFRFFFEFERLLVFLIGGDGLFLGFLSSGNLFECRVFAKFLLHP